MLKRRRHIATRKMEKKDEERKCRIAIDREKWLIERARIVDVDPELLLPPPSSRSGRQSADSGSGWMGPKKESCAVKEDDCEAEDEGIGDVDVSGRS